MKQTEIEGKKVEEKNSPQKRREEKRREEISPQRTQRNAERRRGRT